MSCTAGTPKAPRSAASHNLLKNRAPAWLDGVVRGAEERLNHQVVSV
jgi:hypothetical protein